MAKMLIYEFYTPQIIHISVHNYIISRNSLHLINITQYQALMVVCLFFKQTELTPEYDGNLEYCTALTNILIHRKSG